MSQITRYARGVNRPFRGLPPMYGVARQMEVLERATLKMVAERAIPFRRIIADFLDRARLAEQLRREWTIAVIGMDFFLAVGIGLLFVLTGGAP